MEPDYTTLQQRVARLAETRSNTARYREAWADGLRDRIHERLTAAVAATGLPARVELRSGVENLEAVVLTLGSTRSGMVQKVGDDLERHLIRHDGSLVYQQLFNGKVVVLVQHPYIENYSEPEPPRTVGIYRPEELQEPFFVRHVDEFVGELTSWEDYDDDDPSQRIGFRINFGVDEAEG